MELSSSDKERIQHQYDALAKKTLVGEAKSHRRTLAKRAAREVPFSHRHKVCPCLYLMWEKRPWFITHWNCKRGQTLNKTGMLGLSPFS